MNAVQAGAGRGTRAGLDEMPTIPARTEYGRRMHTNTLPLTRLLLLCGAVAGPLFILTVLMQVDESRSDNKTSRIDGDAALESIRGDCADRTAVDSDPSDGIEI